MPSFIDVHRDIGARLTPDDVAAIHAKDLAVQATYGVRFLKYLSLIHI